MGINSGISGLLKRARRGPHKRRINLLERCRLLFLCFAAVMVLSAYTGLYTANTHTEFAIYGQLLLPVLLIWWIVGFRRKKFPLWIEPLEPIIVTLAGFGFAEIGRAASIFNAALLLRGLYGPLWLGIARLVAYLLGYAILIKSHIDSGAAVEDDIAGMAIGLCMGALLARLLFVSFANHIKTQRREEAVHAASRALAGTRAYSDVGDAIIGPVMTFAGDEDSSGTAIVVNAAGDNTMVIIAVSADIDRRSIRDCLSIDRALLADMRPQEGDATIRLVNIPQWLEFFEKNQLAHARTSRLKHVLFAPFVSTDEVLGGIAVASSERGLQEITESLASLASTASIAIEGIRSRERFASLVRNSNDVVTIINEHGDILYQSSATQRLFGHKDTQHLHRSLKTVIHSEHHWVFDRLLAAVLKSPNTPLAAEWKWQHQDGNWVYTESIATNFLHESTVRGIVLNTRDVTERKRLEEELRHQASHDSLTSLPNRVLLQERVTAALARCKREHSRIAVMYIDLDDFKSINDTYGHEVGDEVLRHFAAILRQSIRAYDTGSRLGGDEFAVLLEDAKSEEIVDIIARRILTAIQTPANIHNYEIRIRASIGVAMNSDDSNREVLMQNADKAMYIAKAGGKDRYRMYHPDMEDLQQL